MSIVAAGPHLYKRHNDGAIFGTTCNPDGSYPEWQLLYDPTTRTIGSTQN